MSNISRGKQFEGIIKQAFLQVPDTSVDRLHDQTTGYLGSANICDFIVYKQPYEYYIECKTIHGNTFPLGNLTDNQYKGLLEKSKINGVIAGVIIWWVDKDTTRFVPIQTIQKLKDNKYKSISYNLDVLPIIEVRGKKKRVFFDYDMDSLIKNMSYDYKSGRWQ